MKKCCKNCKYLDKDIYSNLYCCNFDFDSRPVMYPEALEYVRCYLFEEKEEETILNVHGVATQVDMKEDESLDIDCIIELHNNSKNIVGRKDKEN